MEGREGREREGASITTTNLQIRTYMSRATTTTTTKSTKT